MDFPASNLQHLIQDEYPLADRNWLGIGGPARFFAEPTTRNELLQLVRAAYAGGIPVRVLGSGSNVLIPESGFDGLVLSLGAATLGELKRGQGDAENQLTVGAGLMLSHTVTHAVGLGLGGLEHLIGIPGTIGGAVVKNASAEGRDIGSRVASAEVLRVPGNVDLLSADDGGIQFSHRNSNLTGDILLSVTFLLDHGDVETLTKRLKKSWILRRNVRTDIGPRLVMPFVDPDGTTVAAVIRDCGMDGTRQGAATIETCGGTSNFLVAGDGATSRDCLELIERIREQVLRQLGIDLQLNLQIW
ncbi:MAG: FAD-binding protein [Planctomycetota bacterium]